jgi:hypothetical protein
MESIGIVGGDRHYTGPGLGDGPWKCPACNADQSGPIALGCQDCGAGTAQPYKAPAPAGNVGRSTDAGGTEGARAVPFALVKGDLDQAMMMYGLAEQWAATHDTASLAEAFVAGYALARQQHEARTMSAPPVTADLDRLAPEGKPRRTIVAALDYFKDQILSQRPEEIETGEWCSPEEVDQLIAQLQEEPS